MRFATIIRRCLKKYLWCQLLLVATLAVGCAEHRQGEGRGARDPEYSIGVYNVKGAEQIREITIVFVRNGKSEIRSWGGVSAGHSKTCSFEADPIPERAVVTWRTPDGEHHSAEVQIAAAVPNIRDFTGTIFLRVADGKVSVVPMTYAELDRRAAAHRPIVPE